jgi:hypothetical protein
MLDQYPVLLKEFLNLSAIKEKKNSTRGDTMRKVSIKVI